MKKHPVDDLFKRRLEGLERTPSENAWLKIQGKQPARSRSAVWGWYAAAGVAAAVMGGYLVWQNQQDVSPGGIKPQQTIAAAKPIQKDSAVSPVENLNAPVEQLIAVEKKGNVVDDNAGKSLKSAYKAPRNPEIQVAKAKDGNVPNAKTQHIQTPNFEPEPVRNAPIVALNEQPLVPVNTIQPEPLTNPVTRDIKTLPDEPAVSRVNKPEPEPTRTIVAVVETGTSEAEEKPRNTRFARVFRQLKNARAGEKVDWDEVGFNPKNLVARVDDRLRNKDERSSEKDHPKDKTKL
ncbi:hypothetical protein SAMN05216327_110215 [Dyadobacter sp. SG02]|uniref:hypothetical protein n=1 Tax=Dyadobacter sp. SG02 TaxID=1855291 RepID=UPI0008C27A8F|nr:hypothetical protein [Dyadobacter sp. SG02]SEJ44821.1 hypothetical protein SAMN05216327_110215 [Dyadobacter sp. SG02]